MRKIHPTPKIPGESFVSLIRPLFRGPILGTHRLCSRTTAHPQEPLLTKSTISSVAIRTQVVGGRHWGSSRHAVTVRELVVKPKGSFVKNLKIEFNNRSFENFDRAVKKSREKKLNVVKK